MTRGDGVDIFTYVVAGSIANDDLEVYVGASLTLAKLRGESPPAIERAGERDRAGSSSPPPEDADEAMPLVLVDGGPSATMAKLLMTELWAALPPLPELSPKRAVLAASSDDIASTDVPVSNQTIICFFASIRLITFDFSRNRPLQLTP